MALLSAGVLAFAIAFYRMGVIKFDKKFLIDQVPLIIALAVLMYYTTRTGGMTMTMSGLATAGKMIVGYTPMLILMFLVMGEAMMIVSVHKVAMTTYLAGSHGLWGSLGAAFAMPGTLTSMPIVKELWEGGTSKAPLLVFLLTSPLIGWQIMLMRQPILGWKITGVMFAVSSLTSIIITFVTWIIMVIFK